MVCRGQQVEAAARVGALVVAGCCALSWGLLVYLTDRANLAAGWPQGLGIDGRSLFGAAGEWLPSFAHAFAFSLFTAAALPGAAALRYGACIAWGAINVVFEFGQHPALKAAWAGLLAPSPLAHNRPGRLLAAYCLHGTFDWHDVAAAVGGAVAAACVLRATFSEHAHGT